MSDFGGVLRDNCQTTEVSSSSLMNRTKGRKHHSCLSPVCHRFQSEDDGGEGKETAKMVLERERLHPVARVRPPTTKVLASSKKEDAFLTRLTSHLQFFTKGATYHCYNNNNRQRPFFRLPLSSISVQISSMTKANKVNANWWLRIFSLLYLLIFIWSSLPKSDAALLRQSKCETFGWNAFPVWKYRAKPRYVSPMRIDKRMQEELFELFRGEVYNDRDKDSSEEDDDSHDDVHLDIAELQRIADMCPKDAFFYSLSPKHLEATVAIAQMLTDQPSPPDVLRLARALLKSPYVNPKVWYFGIIGASQERPDMTGFKLAHPVDAMPDIFIPGPLLFEVMDKYRSALQARIGLISNSTSISKKKMKLGRSRGRRSSSSASISQTPLASSQSPLFPTTPRNNTIKRKIKLVRKSSSSSTKKNETSSYVVGGQKDKGLVTPTYSNNTRSDRSYKYESYGGSSSSSSRSRNNFNKGWSLSGKRSKQNQQKQQQTSSQRNGKKKTEVRKGNSSNVTEKVQKTKQDK